MTQTATEVDFDVHAFVPQQYNRTYYSRVMQDEAHLVRWQSTALHDAVCHHLAARGLTRFTHLLEAGAGPAVHHLFALEKYVEAIHVTDFLDANLEEIRGWVESDPGAHDWRPFVKATLGAEGVHINDSSVHSREDAVRSKITRFGHLDLKRPIKAMTTYTAPFVSSFFVADSATNDLTVFRSMTKVLLGMVAPGGLFVGAYLGGCQRYLVGDRWVDSVNLTREQLSESLSAASAQVLRLSRFETPEMVGEGYDHIFTVVATMPEPLAASPLGHRATD